MATPASSNPHVTPTPPRMIPVVAPAEAPATAPVEAAQPAAVVRPVTGWSPTAWRRGRDG